MRIFVNDNHAVNGVANCRETRGGRSGSDSVQATADEAAKVRQGMIAVRIPEGIVKNKYNNNPVKLAAWLSASHVEKGRRKRRRQHHSVVKS